MSNAGRKPKPTVIKQLEGNPGKRNIDSQVKLEESIETYTDGEIPTPPEWIKKNKIAYEEWQRVAPILAKTKILKQADIVALEAYCKCWSRYREAEEQMDAVNSTFFKTPSGYVQQLPQVAISQKYLKLAKEFMVEFGLTPSSRGRMLLPRRRR